MLTIETLGNIEALVHSDALTIKGSQLNFVFGLLAQIAQEKQALQIAARVQPASPTTPPRVDPSSP